MSTDEPSVRPRRRTTPGKASGPASGKASAPASAKAAVLTPGEPADDASTAAKSAPGKGTPRKAAAAKSAAPKSAAPKSAAGKSAADKSAADQTTSDKKTAERAPAPAKRGRPVVAVTGAAHGLGELLVRRLASSDAVKKVIAIDTIRGDVAEATWRLVDVRDPGLADRLSGVDVVVHLAVESALDHDNPDYHAAAVRAAATVLTAAPAAGVKHVVLVTSAMVYGAQADNPVPLSEDAELQAAADSDSLGDLLEIERLAAQAPRTHPGLQVTVLRPAALVGGGVDTILTRHFEAPRLLAVKGSRTRWQFCHADDLVSALELVVTVGLTADDNTAADHTPGLVVAAVGSDGWLERADVERITGKRHIELPASVAFGTAERLHRLGVTPAASSDLQYLVHPWVVDAHRLAAHGWRPAYDNEAALRVAMAESSGSLAIGGHRLGRRDAAAGAAVGATVALVGTAALVRRARRRRRG
jgi:nucleoside-diphosphate-sugar epimerase